MNDASRSFTTAGRPERQIICRYACRSLVSAGARCEKKTAGNAGQHVSRPDLQQTEKLENMISRSVIAGIVLDLTTSRFSRPHDRGRFA
jgi:hypothetical protein